MRRAIVLFFLFTIAYRYSSAQILINEICSNNQCGFPDDNMEFHDWIEFYNPSSSSINLLNYKLSDDPQLLSKWEFPEVTVPAKGYLTVYASGKNKNTRIDHWEAAVLDEDNWKYVVPYTDLLGWNRISYNDSWWMEGEGGIGYGDDDDRTVIASSARAVYMRKNFTISDPAAINGMMLYMDCDDGFVAYINGTEIARYNMNATAANTFAIKDQEALMYGGNTPLGYYIPPSVFRSLLQKGNNVLAVQVHQAYSFAAYSDLTARPFLFLGLNIGSDNYRPLPEWAPELPQVVLHTNFSLDSDGEKLFFSDPSGKVMETVTIPKLGIDESYGIYPGTSSNWQLLKPATPDAPNTTSVAYSGYIQDVPIVSLPSGFYSGEQIVACSCKDVGAEIRYTIDGSKPDVSSLLYTAPLSFAYTTVLRVGCFKPGFITRHVETNTYFINEAKSTLPVFAISTHNDNFMNADTGIYVTGLNAQPYSPHYGANYWQDWEREVHVEFFDKNKSLGFEQDCGVEIFGGWSRMQPMKSLRLKPAEKYGKDKFNYPLFSHRPGITEYDQINLRNGGNDFNWTHLRDQTNHRVLGNSVAVLGNKTNIDFSEYEPVVVYLNGQYWGIHHMRERYNQGYLKSYYGISQGGFELLEADGDVKKQNNFHFTEMVDFILNNSMNDPVNYNKVKEMLDIQNFVDYFIAQTYHANWDWPHNNIKCWRPSTPEGKWRYLYYDTDFSLGIFGSDFGTSVDADELNRVIEDTRSSHSIIFKKLLTNEEFRNYFINRYADLINTIYKPSSYWGTFDALRSEIEPEMERHLARWPYNIGSVYVWNYYCQEVQSWIEARPAYARSFIKNKFNLEDTVTITLKVVPAGAGVVKISTIIPDSYPWTGTYFNGLPVSITAIPNAGYSFSAWTSSNISLDASVKEALVLNLEASNVFTAQFVPTENTSKIVINEINFNSDNDHKSGNWVEFFNHGNTPADLSGWMFRDSKDYHTFTFPKGTIVKAGQYLVLVNDTADFSQAYPEVKNKVGPFNFNLDNKGETLRLYDQYNRLYLSITYNNKAPWPPLADGYGTTLELINPDGNVNDGKNWFDGCRGGSPGKAYIPCPCASVNLGTDRALCAEEGLVSLGNDLKEFSNKNFQWYYNNKKLSGAIHPLLTVSAPGTYRLIADSAGCIQTDEVNVFNNIDFDFGNDFTLCNPITKVLDSRLIIQGLTYTWKKNGIVLPVGNSSYLEVKTPGIYSLTATLPGCPSFSDELVVSTGTAVPIDDHRLEKGEVTLGVEGNGVYKWYETSWGGKEVGEGNTFTTPELSSTKTYYVQDETYFHGTAGKTDNYGRGFYVMDFSYYRMIFNASKEFKLDAITVYSMSDSSEVTLRILKNEYNVLYSKTMMLPAAGENRIALGWEIPYGNGYIVDAAGTNGLLFMSYAFDYFAYPYKLVDANHEEIVSISQQPSWATNYYPYFYKWEISSFMGSPCARIPVTATILDSMVSATIVTDGPSTICEGSSITLRTNTGDGKYMHQWQNNGVDIPGATSASLIVSQEGNYTVINRDEFNTATSNPVAVKVVKAPTIALAGKDQYICSDETLLDGNLPLVGTGKWTVRAGNGVFENINNPLTDASQLAVGTNIFRWTIEHETCPPSYDEVFVYRYAPPSQANAGTDQQLCMNIAVLEGNDPEVGMGKWELKSGNGVFNDNSDSGATISQLATGTNVLVWTITHGTCLPTRDEVSITVSGGVNSVNAGIDQKLCHTFTSELHGNKAISGSGYWSTNGEAIITNPSEPNTSIEHLQIGSNIFTWTITDGICTLSDDVEVIVYDSSSVANAGEDQYITNGFTQLQATIPMNGEGEWQQLSGGGFISTSRNPFTSVGSLSPGENIYEWIVSNGVCPATSDQVSVIVGSSPLKLTIVGPVEADTGITYLYSVQPQPYASYEWSLPLGAELIDGKGTEKVSIRFGESGGIIVVKVVTPFGEISDSLEVDVFTPVYGGLPEETASFYPNPFTDEGTMKIRTDKKMPLLIKVTDMKGVEVYREDQFTNEAFSIGSSLPSGIYLVEALYGETLVKVRVVKMK